MSLNLSAHTASSDEILPLLTFNAKSGRFSLVEKVDVNGAWQKQEDELSEADCVFVMDFATAQKGWMLFKQGMAPVKVLVPRDTPDAQFPARPEGDWGTDQYGKPILPRAGFVLHVLTKDGKKREFASNAVACITGIGQIDAIYEKAPEAKAGQLPVVKLVRTIKVGKNGNYQPEFTVAKWIPRPAALGGSAPAPAPEPKPKPEPKAEVTTARVLEDAVPFAPEWR